jgi:hypothetical protein
MSWLSRQPVRRRQHGDHVVQFQRRAVGEVDSI